MGTCWWPLADTAGQWHTNNLGSSWHKNLFSFTIPPKKSPNDKNMTPQYSNTSWHRQFLFLVFVCSIIEFIWHLPSVVAFWINSFVVIKTTMGPRLRFLMYYSQRCLDLASNKEIFNMDKILKQRNIPCHHQSTKSSDSVKQARMISCRRSSELVWPKQSKKGTKTFGIVWIISTSYDLSFSFFLVDNEEKRFSAKRYFHQLELKYQKHQILKLGMISVKFLNVQIGRTFQFYQRPWNFVLR